MIVTLSTAAGVGENEVVTASADVDVEDVGNVVAGPVNTDRVGVGIAAGTIAACVATYGNLIIFDGFSAT